MKRQNIIFKTVTAAIAALGLVSTDAIAQTPGPAPTTSSAFRMYNSSSNWITIAAGPTAGTGTFLWPAVGAGVFKSDTSGAMSIGQITAADLQLTQNSLFVGGPGNTAIELAAGATGQVLQIVGGTPTWQTLNLLPTGTDDHATLVWDAASSAWVENTNVTMDNATGNIATTGDVSAVDGSFSGNATITGDATINGNSTLGNASDDQATINAATVVAPNLPTTGGPLLPAHNVLITDASGNVTETSPDNIVGAATLPQNNIYVGDATNHPAAVAPGTPGQVLQINGANTPTWETLNLLPTGTVENSTLVWDNVNNVWEENTQVTMDEASGDITTTGDVSAVDGSFSGNATITGNAVIHGNSTLGDASDDQATIYAGTVAAPNLPTTAGPLLSTHSVLITDASGIVTETSPDNIVDAATLPQNNIYVGDATNHPAPVAPGTNGQVLQIVGSAPTWQSLNLLPTGTVENSTLVWDNVNNVWEENTQVTMDEVSGDITTTGDVNAVDGSFSGNTTIGDASIDQATINAATVVAPNLPTTAGPLTTQTVLITDATGNVSETSPDNIVDAATLLENNIYVGDANDHPAAVAPGSNGDVLTIVGSTPTWSTPTGTIAAKGKVTGSGTWTYTVNPGVNPSGAATIIMVTLTSTSGLQVTHAVTNITATTFDVQFPVNIGASETFHWMVIQ